MADIISHNSSYLSRRAVMTAAVATGAAVASGAGSVLVAPAGAEDLARIDRLRYLHRELIGAEHDLRVARRRSPMRYGDGGFHVNAYEDGPGPRVRVADVEAKARQRRLGTASRRKKALVTARREELAALLGDPADWAPAEHVWFEG